MESTPLPRVAVVGDCPADRPGCVAVGQSPLNAVMTALCEHGPDVFTGPLPGPVARTVAATSQERCAELAREYAAKVRDDGATLELWWRFADRFDDELTRAVRCLRHDADEHARHGVTPPAPGRTEIDETG